MSERDAEQTAITTTFSIFARTQEGEFSLERAKFEERALAAAHRRQLEAEEAQLRREETRKDNDLRRRRELIGFYVAVGASLVVLAISFVVAVAAENDGVRNWSQGIVTLVMGGIVGGLAGYLTGRSTK